MATYSDKQLQVLRNADARWNILSGAVRSGKSFVSLDLLLLRLADMPPGNRLLIGKTERTLQRNVLDPLRARFGAAYVSRPRDPGVVDIFGQPFYLAGANDSKSVTKIQGMGLVYAYGDEVTTWAPEVFKMLQSRLDKKGARFDGTCNPEGPYHWFKRDFLDKSGLNMKHFHFTIDDNPFLAPEFVAALKQEYSGVWYDRYIRGLWVAAEGAIFDMFDEHRHVSDQRLPGAQKAISCDYGTVNPCVFQLIEDDGHRIHVPREYYHDSREKLRQKTDEEYADDLGRFLQENGLRAWDIEGVYVDPSAKSFIVTLQKRGYNVMRVNNDVADGIRTVGTLLHQGRLTIDPSCTKTREGFTSYVWDEKAQERGEDKPLKENDHTMDSLRYYCHTKHKTDGTPGPVRVRF